MGLFDKRKKMEFRKASEVMLALGLTYPDQGIMIKQEIGVDDKHRIAVCAGYMLGISLLNISSQIGLDQTDRFISEAMNNAKDILMPEMFSIIPQIQEYATNIRDFVLKEAVNLNQNDIFPELAKRFLKDLFNGEFEQKYFSIAIEEMRFYYSTCQNFTNKIRITK